MAELPSVDSEIEGRGYVAYPRPNPVLPVADRLEALGKAYFGLGLPYLATFAFIVSVFGLTLTPFVNGGIFDTVVTVALYSTPVVAGIVSYVPMRRFALGSGRRPGAAIGFSAAITLYIATVALLFLAALWPTDMSQQERVISMLELVLVAMTVFPLARVLIVLQMRKLGFRSRLLWPSKKRLEAEVLRLREEQRAI